MTVFWVVFVVGLIFFVLRAAQVSRRIDQGEGPKVLVETVKGDAAARRRIEYYLARGYELQGQGSRKVMWSPVTGVFTRKQKHTLTFVKTPPTAPPMLPARFCPRCGAQTPAVTATHCHRCGTSLVWPVSGR